MTEYDTARRADAAGIRSERVTITRLSDKNQEANEDVISALEDALELAKSGRMRSVAIAASLTGHATFTAYETRDLQEAIGLVGFLHHTLCARQRETPAN